ncbi:MAG: Flp pilus assembly complex ATPase component TadA [Phycisphaerales bacterium]|nr:Flp pilus assembly complex ATPase component TadA [Phycisphaerales bacterium]
MAPLDSTSISPAFIGCVPIGFARRFGIIGIDGDKGSLTVAMASPKSLCVAENVGILSGVPITPVLADGDEIQAVINRAYGERGGDVDGVVDAIRLDAGEGEASGGNGSNAARLLSSLEGGTDLLDDASSAPVIRLVNAILFEAVKRRASDVHVQPYADRVQVRLRVDGVLYDFVAPPKRLHEEMVSRIKVVAGLNIAEKRLPQDGRTTVSLGERVVDLRISTLPTCHGERVVLRLLDKSARLYALDELGMGPAELSIFNRLIRRTHGLFLVTGPTGSGKSTRLYGALQALDATQLNILTIEDPIEYRLPGISQTQVSDKKGLTFASGLRTILRQDPDVIMVGEIRDEATARMAVQSALTGHLVFSTLHGPASECRGLMLALERTFHPLPTFLALAEWSIRDPIGRIG